MNLFVIAPWKPGRYKFVGNVLQSIYGGKTIATELYLSEDGTLMFKDPYTVGHDKNPMSDDAHKVLTALNFAPPPPDDRRYWEYIKTAARAVLGRSAARAVMREFKYYEAELLYLIDRLTGRGIFSGYGVAEAAIALNNISTQFVTEVVLPQNPLAKPARLTRIPRNIAERYEQLKTEVVQYGNYRTVVVQLGEVRLPTNIVIAGEFIPMLVKRLHPGLTYDHPMDTIEDRHYMCRIAADVVDYNVNIRKMGKVPVPTETAVSPSVGAADVAEVMGYLAYSLFDLKTGVLISGAMGSGKTYKLNELLYLTPPNYQIVVVERGAKEILTPLIGQLLSIRITHEDQLSAALSQALRYGTALTAIVQAEARTALELYYMAMYKLTGHGNATTMHAESPFEAVTRIAEAKAPIEGLRGIVIMQLRAEETGKGLRRVVTHLYRIVEREEAVDPIEHPRLAPMGLALENPLKRGLPERAKRYAAVFRKIIGMMPLDARNKAVEMLRL
jgi:type IV secretory pathway ATPase VirB11/archaellum biosynthesis ATPase